MYIYGHPQNLPLTCERNTWLGSKGMTEILVHNVYTCAYYIYISYISYISYMYIHIYIYIYLFSIILHFNSMKRRDSGSSLGSESLAWDVADVAAAALCKATGNDLVVTFHEVCMILIPDRPLLYIYIKP